MRLTSRALAVGVGLILTLAGCTATGHSDMSGGPPHTVPIHKARNHHTHKASRGHHERSHHRQPSHRSQRTKRHHQPKRHRVKQHKKPDRHKASGRPHILPTRHLPPGVPARDVPRRTLTPGVVLTTNAARVCVSGYSSRVRDVPSTESEAAYARYGVSHVPYQHEVDHLISLELGGANSIRNLWPEPYAGRWGARTKDVLENKLHELVCSGALNLPRAQRMEATNWIAAYKKYVGTTPRAPAPQPLSNPRPTRLAPMSDSCEPGYSPCLPVTGDLDCGDLSSAQTPVRVTGSDPYRLDADGDGYGCDS
jgi:hypothetical protein